MTKNPCTACALSPWDHRSIIEAESPYPGIALPHSRQLYSDCICHVETLPMSQLDSSEVWSFTATNERCSKFSCGFHTIIKTLRQSLRFAYVSQVLAYDRYVSMIWAYGDLTAKEGCKLDYLDFIEFPQISIVPLRFSGGYVLLLGSMLLGTSGHLVKSCETDPMGQGSFLAALAYGRLTFRLRFAYGPDTLFFRIFQILSIIYEDIIRYNSRQWVKLDSRVISHNHKS